MISLDFFQNIFLIANTSLGSYSEWLYHIKSGEYFYTEDQFLFWNEGLALAKCIMFKARMYHIDPF